MYNGPKSFGQFNTKGTYVPSFIKFCTGVIEKVSFKGIMDDG